MSSRSRKEELGAMAAFSTKDMYGEYVIKGKVLKATYEVVRGGIALTSKELNVQTETPYQLNNMLAWAQAVVKNYGDGNLSRALGKALREGKGVDFEMNDGAGRLKGRSASQNLLKVFIDSMEGEPKFWVLVVRIYTESHSYEYHRRVKAGLVVPPSQKPEVLREKRYREQGIPFYTMGGTIVLPTPQSQFATEFEFTPDQFEMFYSRYPEWRDKVKRLDEPDGPDEPDEADQPE